MTDNANKGLKGKVIVITGAGGVLCSRFAQILAETGAKVALLDRTYEKAKIVEDQIVSRGQVAKAYACNVLDKEMIEKVSEEVIKDLGTCDILINGAGGNSPKATTDKEYYEEGDLDNDTKSFFDLDEEGVSFVFDLNFKGTLIPTQVFAKQMLGKSDCSIINISSMNAFTPLTKIPAYSAAKSAVTNFTKWLAVHFSRQGIRVNAIAPGFFATAQNRTLLFNEDGTPTDRTRKILAATPFERFGEAEELDGVLLFLADSNVSSFITGVCIPVDGGFSAYSGV